MRGFEKFMLAAVAAVSAVSVSVPAMADGMDLSLYGLSAQRTRTPYFSWMSPEVRGAWWRGYQGQGTTMYFVDDFSNSQKFVGKLTRRYQYQGHGFWTTEEAGLIAPQATVVKQDFSTEVPISLPSGFTAVNLSYGLVGTSGGSINWSQYPQEQSIIAAATNGTALISKSAGNDSTTTTQVAVGQATPAGKLDFLNVGLIGTQSTIFVGSLDYNGTTSNPAPLSYYSDIAGTNAAVQSHYLTVGVDYNMTNLAGTSFAAPIITAYAAILSSKFTTATPTQVANQLLSTARTDTVVNYTASTYGMGEASLANALAPASIN